MCQKKLPISLNKLRVNNYKLDTINQDRLDILVLSIAFLLVLGPFHIGIFFKIYVN